MKLFAHVLVSVAFATTAHAAGNTQSVWTGGTAGTYFKFLGPAVKTSLESINRSMLRKQTVFVKESDGSTDNIDKALASPDDFGLAQKDVIAIRTLGDDRLLDTLKLKRVDARELTIVREDIVSECLYMVVGKEFADQVDSFGQILSVADGLTVATASDKSGSHATLSYIRSVVPEMKNTQIKNYKSAAEAIQKVASGDESVAFFVQMPDPANDLFKAVAEKGLGIIGVAHENMFNLTVKDLPVYEARPTTVQDASFGAFIGVGKKAKQVETACVPVTIVTSEKTNPQIVAKLKAVDVAALRPQVDWFQNMLNTSTKSVNPDSLLSNVKSGLNRGITYIKKN